jgi:hypothetical protein
MIVFILLGCAAAKMRGYRCSPMWRDVSLYPLFAMECAYWFVQVCAFAGNYSFLPYAGHLQSAFLLSMLFPILKHRLHARAIVGTGMVLAGTALNKLVIAANGGKMPVYATLSRLTGYYNPNALAQGFDTAHTIGGANTALRFLGDYIDVGFSIMSPGDVLIHGFIAVIVYGAIKSMNKQEHGGAEN